MDLPGPSYELRENNSVLCIVGPGDFSYPPTDIMSVKAYAAFNMQVQVQVKPNSNSGLYYFVNQYEDYQLTRIAPEYNIVGTAHPDNSHSSGTGHMGAYYKGQVTFAHGPVYDSPGSWNDVEITVDTSGEVVHKLNGVEIVRFNVADRDTYGRLIRIQNDPQFWTKNTGHIGMHKLLRTTDEEVCIRNLVITELSTAPPAPPPIPFSPPFPPSPPLAPPAPPGMLSAGTLHGDVVDVTQLQLYYDIHERHIEVWNGKVATNTVAVIDGIQYQVDLNFVPYWHSNPIYFHTPVTATMGTEILLATTDLRDPSK